MIMNTITLQYLQTCKQKKEKISCLTVYDASFANLLSQCGVEILLIGDTLGIMVQGHETTVPVTMVDMIYHTQCVARRNQGAFLLADMPFMSYSSPSETLHHATQLIQAGGHAIKLEGGYWLCDTVNLLCERGLVVCGHLGVTPQSVHKQSGYHKQGRDRANAQQLLADAKSLQQAGASLLVLECVLPDLAKEISESLEIPTIGIGSGPHCDAQVLVLYDILGLSYNKVPGFASAFLNAENPSLAQAVSAYVRAVKDKTYPM
jgi:3-methyl-2-oxobutanoate hydroxymethyltransferase